MLPAASSSSPDGQEDSEKIFLLVAELTNPEQRESALLELSKRRETFVDLAPILWHSFGTISALLQEIVAIYPLLSPPSLTAQASNRVCNALALLQCVASHPETRTLFLNGAASPPSPAAIYVLPLVSRTSSPPAICVPMLVSFHRHLRTRPLRPSQPPGIRPYLRYHALPIVAHSSVLKQGRKGARLSDPHITRSVWQLTYRSSCTLS